MESDADLLRAWQDGDAAAGERLFDRHYRAVARFFRNKVDGAIDDLVQTTFVGMLEAKDRFRGEGSFRSYAFGIAFNVLRTHYRGRRRDAQVDFAVTSLRDLGAGPASMAAAKAEQRLLLEGLRRIPAEHQSILELYFWEPLTAGEIAAVFDLPVGTVRTRIRRAKALLAEQIAEVGGQGEALLSTTTSLEDWARQVRPQ